MPTFRDPITIEDIDINDTRAKFYIINIGVDRYKFCGITQNLDSYEMICGDPETREKEYWPVNLEQINPEKMAMLFPEGEIRKEPISLLELK